MHAGEDLLILGLLFVGAYILGRLGKLIGLPTIPIYMIVGVLASPHTYWFPLSFPAGDIELIAVFGLVLLLFSLGLEFDQDEFFGNAKTLLISGGSWVLINMGAGFIFGLMVGWGAREALVIAGMTGTSSSAIITKLLIELRRLANTETPMILGVTVVGDIFIAIYLSIVSVVLRGETEIWPIVLQLSIAFLFLIVMFSLARWGGRVVSRLVRTKDDELFTILFFGLVVLFAGIGEIIGVTDAIGAFLIGVVLGASTYRAKIERVAVPLRDVFAAFFFLNFGLALDIAEFPPVIGVVLIAVVMTFILSLGSGVLLAYLHKMGRREALNTAAIFVNRGEFTLILATLSLGAGLDARLQPFAGLYVLSMAILGPLFTANSEKIGAYLSGSRPTVSRKPRDAMLEEEIALVEAAIANPQGADTRRAVGRVTDARPHAERGADVEREDTDARPAASERRPDSGTADDSTDSARGSTADDGMDAARGSTKPEQSEGGSDSMLDFVTDRLDTHGGPRSPRPPSHDPGPNPSALPEPPADKPDRDTGPGDYS